MDDAPESFVTLEDCEECLLCGSIVRSQENAIHLLQWHPKVFRATLSEGVGELEASRIIKTLYKHLHLGPTIKENQS